jgi:hypothetical protein
MVDMLREVPVIILALIPALAWAVFLLPIVFRLWGISLPLNPLKRRNLRLNADERVFLQGVAGYGVTLSLFHLGCCYFRWALYRHLVDRPSGQTFIDALGVGVFSGIIVGLFTGIQDARGQLNERPRK